MLFPCFMSCRYSAVCQHLPSIWEAGWLSHYIPTCAVALVNDSILGSTYPVIEYVYAFLPNLEATNSATKASESAAAPSGRRSLAVVCQVLCAAQRLLLSASTVVCCKVCGVCGYCVLVVAFSPSTMFVKGSRLTEVRRIASMAAILVSFLRLPSI